MVDEGNAIGTTYLRAQTVAEPQRSQSLMLLKQFTDTSIRISRTVPGSATQASAVTASGQIQRQLWALAAQSLNKAPTDSAARLYVDSLNEMFDSQSRRIYSLGNRVPTPVLVLEVAGAAIAIGSLALHLATLGGRGVFTVMIAAVLVIVILLVTFRPRPSDAWPHPDTINPVDAGTRRNGAAPRGTRTKPLDSCAAHEDQLALREGTHLVG